MINTSDVHIGQLVKAVFDESGMTVAELARKLNYERTNVYTIFKRRTIDVELLAILSEILNHNFLNDAMRLYGLTAKFSPQFHINISLDDCSKENAESMVELLESQKRNRDY